MKNNEKVMEGLPYTVVMHTQIPQPILSILLTAEGIKEIAKRVKDGDLIRIEQWTNYTNECRNKKHFGRISVISGDVK